MKLKNWIRRSFRNRVFATILVVTLVPLLLCDVVMMQVIVARAEHTQARQARAALDMLSQRFDEAADQCGDTLEALATSTITRSVLRRTEPDSRLLYQFLYRSAAAMRSYADLEIYDAQGACLYSTDGHGLGRAVRRPHQWRHGVSQHRPRPDGGADRHRLRR